ncbi:MAG TPA: HD domain-containing phosphohydrolase [Gemmatimonadota bacterium]|nr:HD domain-containing phosphohydrolase [Gemmatimonadota bacterium]
MNHPHAGDVSDARILIVDDDPANVELLERILKPSGYGNIVKTTDSRRAVQLCIQAPVDLVLLDLRMPHMDGIEVMAALRKELPEFSFPPVLVLTSDTSREAKQRALSSGARDFLTKPLSPSEVRLRVANLLENRLLHRALLHQNERLEEMVFKRTRELEEARIQILERLAIAAEYHDPETGAHTRRVGEDCARIAETLGLPRGSVELIHRSAPLHDVGKIGVHDEILRKPAPLTVEEFDAMKMHTIIGEQILSGSGIALLDMAAEIALCHHEHWDGSGYPHGIAGDEIPLAARIVTVADVFDSLTHERPYKSAWKNFEALNEIELLSGSKFDPRVVQAFMRVLLESAA